MHQNTNLIGSSDSETTGYLNTTFAFNWWGTGCKMARVGKIHMLNNYFNCSGSSNCINPRKNSEFLIEGNYFDKGVKRFYKSDNAKAVIWASSNYHVENNSLGNLDSFGTTVTVPPTAVKEHAGATLKYGESTGITSPTSAIIRQSSAIYNLAGQKVNESYKGVVIKNGKKVVQ